MKKIKNPILDAIRASGGINWPYFGPPITKPLTYKKTRKKRKSK